MLFHIFSEIFHAFGQSEFACNNSSLLHLHVHWRQLSYHLDAFDVGPIIICNSTATLIHMCNMMDFPV